MDVNDYGNGQEKRCLSEEETLELERLDGVREELQAKYESLYIEHENLHYQHVKTVKDAKELEHKHFEMDNQTYLKQWRRLYEEEITLQELGATIRQYAEEVRRQRQNVWLVREQLIRDPGAC